MKAVGMKKAGPQLGVLTAAVMDWQLGHPLGSAEECLTYLTSTYSHMSDC